MAGFARRFVIGLSSLIIVACTTQPPAPIEQKSGGPPPMTRSTTLVSQKPAIPGAATYRVEAGDTLYSIAWRLGIDYHELAAANGVTDPKKIYVGQVLQTHKQTALATKPAPHSTPITANSSPEKTTGVPAASVLSPTPPSTTSASTSAPKTGALKWIWPADGAASRATSANGAAGVEIRGQRGATVKAAAAGQVVYAGNGLRGYGQLLIIKHDEAFLSAYAHNDKLLVSEGQHVAQGQPIALMGDSEASEVMLHFEIRKGGKAVEPMQYLPQH